MATTVPKNGVTNYGCPMSGTLANLPTSGRFPIGTTYLATDQGANGVLYMQTANGWFPASSGGAQLGLVAITASGAVAPSTPGSYVITDTSVAALTLAAPTAGADDGKVIEITSSTTAQHTLTATGLFQSGGTAVNVATWPAHAGGTLRIMAYQGKWIILSNNLVVMS